MLLSGVSAIHSKLRFGYFKPNIDYIVDDCVNLASENNKEFRDNNFKTDKDYDKKDFISRCIRKQLTVQCPDWTKSDSCDALMAFAKYCPMYGSKIYEEKEEKKGENSEEVMEKKVKRQAEGEDQVTKRRKTDARKAMQEERKAEKKERQEKEKAQQA